MKKLYIIRHAKSSWDSPELSDFERPLNKRGIRDVPDMGQRLYELGIKPDLIISSPANRAITTARGIAKAINFPTSLIQQEIDLYHASTSTIKEVISQVDQSVNQLMIFGHNPGFTDLISRVSEFNLYNLPTCAVCGISFSFDNWSRILTSRGEKFLYDYPKSKKGYLKSQ